MHIMTRKTRFLCMAAVASALALAGCKKSGSDENAGGGNVAPVAASTDKAPAGGWTETVELTPDGGFRMGDAKAPATLIEYGSLTCPHCADFNTEAVPTLKQWVASGKLSYEYRNFVRDPYDLTAALLARCGGAGPFFKLTDQMYASQKDWVGKAEKITDADSKRIQALPPEQQAAAIAQVMGLDAFVAQRGIPSAKAQQCLTDKAAQQKLVDMRQVATTKYNLAGTPTFIVNGDVVEGADWASLKAKLAPLMGG
jgi:protein-disulfide isomerase